MRATVIRYRLVDRLAVEPAAVDNSLGARIGERGRAIRAADLAAGIDRPAHATIPPAHGNDPRHLSAN